MLSYNMITVSGDQPEWQRTSFLCDKGRVFIAAGIFGEEEFFSIVSIHDGEESIFEDGHLYLDTQYLAAGLPVHMEQIENLELSARRAFHSAFFTGELK